MKWRKVKLGVVSKFQTGKTPPTIIKEYFEGDINWYCPGDIGKEKVLTESTRKLSEKAIIDKKAVVHETNTILLTCIGDIGRVGIASTRCSSNQQITGLTFSPEVFPEYAYYWFLSNKKIIRERANNAVVPILNNESLKDFEIPLPPLSVQREIAEVLDRADALRKKDQLLLQKYDELAQSIFYDMFGDPVKNEKGWEVKELGSLCSSFKYGTNIKSDNEILPESVPVIRIPNVLNDTVVFENLKYSIIPSKELQNVALRPGDLLFVRSNGNPTYIGRCAVYNSNFKAAYASYLIRSRVSDVKQVLPQFIQSVISNEQYRSVVIQKATTTAGNYNINTVSLKSLPIIVPSLSLQRSYSDTYSKISRLKKTITKNIIQSDDFFNKLSNQYLN